MTQEVEPLVLVGERAVIVLAVHDARLVGMKLQTDPIRSAMALSTYCAWALVLQ